MGRTSCTEAQCLYKGALYIYIYIYIYILIVGGGQSVATEIKVNTEFRWLQSPVADRPQFRSRNIDV